VTRQIIFLSCLERLFLGVNMGVWVVVGGQFGSEGKGKISSFITQKENIDICVRCGGPNSGHCFTDNYGVNHVLRQIPSGILRLNSRLLIPSGGLIDIDVLVAELNLLKLGPERVGIDANAMIIQPQDIRDENDLNMRTNISSTLCGVGAAVSRKILRGNDIILAKDIPEIKSFIVDASKEINTGIDDGKNILVEGTQGFGLSLYHGGFYPKATSRDTSASGCISECGISPLLVNEIVMVLRTFPIRVAGQQAVPLYNEIDWETLQEESGYSHSIKEYTTVTKKLRRVGRFDYELLKRAIEINRPTKLAINFVDYLDCENINAKRFDDLTDKTKFFIWDIEHRFGIPVSYIGYSPNVGLTLSL